MEGKGGSRWVDRAIGRIAARQHSVVGRAQLLACGITAKQIEFRIACGRLVAIHRGVYAVGHGRLTREGRWMAAVIAAGDGAVLSHRSAAALWGLMPHAAEPEVTHDGSSKLGPAVRVHRGDVPLDERTEVAGIPVTTVARTLLDLAATVPRVQLERAHREAHVLRLPVGLASLVERYPGRRGIRAARALLGDAVTRSELESRFRRFLRSRGIPLPDATNVDLGFGEADCVWFGARLNVELDGHSTHRTRASFERDRARDRRAVAAGWRVIRVTSRQLRDEPERLARDLRAALA